MQNMRSSIREQLWQEGRLGLEGLVRESHPSGCSSVRRALAAHSPGPRAGGGPDKQHRLVAFLPALCVSFPLGFETSAEKSSFKSGIPWAFQSIPFSTVSMCCVCTAGQWLEPQRGTVTLWCAKPVVRVREQLEFSHLGSKHKGEIKAQDQN